MDNSTLLHRQVNPAWIQAGRVTSQVFRPTPKDQSLLSVYDGDLISAENAWKHFTEKMNFRSVGVLSVCVMECEQQLLAVRPDPEPFPEHAVIDFSNFTKNEVERKAKLLKKAAEARGWRYREEVSI